MNLSKDLEKALKSHAKKLEEEIYKRTKRGKGVAVDNGNARSFKDLSDSYVKQRQRMKLGPGGRPDFSNLTQTGEMLEDFQVTDIRVDDKGIHVRLGFSDSKNADKAKWVSEDRPWMHLDARQVKELQDLVEHQSKIIISKEIADLIKKL